MNDHGKFYISIMVEDKSDFAFDNLPHQKFAASEKVEEADQVYWAGCEEDSKFFDTVEEAELWWNEFKSDLNWYDVSTSYQKFDWETLAIRQTVVVKKLQV